MFKTYDNDIDGITNKLGFSKRSFAEWGEQVSKAFAESEGKMNKFKNTMNAAFVPQTGKNNALIEEFNDFIFLMNDEGLTAKETAEILGNDLSPEIQRYVKNSKDGKITTDGFKNSIGEMSIGAKAGKIALQGLVLVGNALAMAFASWVATEIISWINNLAHAEENARKRSEELTSSYETEKKDIDDSIAKYKELSEKLNDTSLSTSEVKSIKEQLLSVQDQLNEKYGAEATQIDLVNGKYDEQIEKLDKLSKKKAGDYVAENYNDIKADQKYVSEEFNVNKSLGFKGNQSKPDDYTNAGFDLKKYLDRYDKLDAKVVNPDGQYGMSGTVNLVTNGTRQEVYDQITALFNDLSNDFGNSNEGVNAFKSTLNDILKSSFDTNELAAANDRIKKYAEAEILSNDDASTSYNNLVDAVDNYNTALSSGKGVDDAKSKLVEAKKAAQESTNEISNSGKVLQDVYNSLSNEAPIEFQVEIGKNVDKDLKQSYEDTINRFKSDVSDSSSKELDSLNKQLDEQTQKLNEANENLQKEYDKISKWELDDYADQIKNGTLPSQFGNVDMDNRQIIDWNIDNIEKWKDALQDIKYYDDDGNFIDSYYDQLKESAENGESCIDSVFGDMIDHIEGYGDITALAFSHVVNNDDGTFEFLGQKTAEEYLYGILDVAKQDGDMSIDHILELDKKGFENAEVYDAQGKVIGETYIHGIISGFNENAADISSLTHFAGKDGAIQIAQSDIDTYNKQIEETKKKIEEVSKEFDDSQKIKDFFDTEGINTDEEINEFNKVTEDINRADEAIQKWNEHKKESATNSSFTKDPTSLLTESDNKSKTANLADLKSEADTLKSLQKELEDTGVIGVDSMQKIIKQYPEAKEALYDYMTGVKNEAELFADLENIYNDDKNQYINSMVEQNQANEDFFASLKAKYPEIVTEMQNLVDQTNALLDQQKENYINSIVSEEESCQAFLNFIRETYPELYAQLSEIYGNDEENFIRHIISENETNQEFIDALSKLYPALANNLATTYGNDVNNWTSMEQAKAQITANLINQLNEMWSEYFDGISETFGAFGSIMENADGSGYTFLGGQDDSMYYDHNMTEDEWQASQKAVQSYNAVKEKIQKSINLANATVKDLEGAAYNSIESSVGGLDYDSLGKDVSSDSDKGSSNDSDSGSEPTPEDFDWIERAVKKIERTISNLSSVVDDTYSSWSTRNNALANELNAVSEEIGIQEQAAQKYFELADNVGLEEDYQNLVKNGDFNVETVTDDGLKERIKEFQDFYDKAQDCNDKIKDLSQNLKELQKTKFDNIASQFESTSSSISHAITMLDKYINLSEKKGYYASSELYQKQLDKYNNDLNNSINERNELQASFQESVQSGLLEEGSEGWNNMKQQIEAVNEKIMDTVINIQEVGNSARDLGYTIFERGQDDISNFANEGQFYIDLLEKMNKDLYDDDGKITNEGMTVQGIHSVNYATYLKQADFYAKEISAIEAKLANDPANTTLIDKKQEYIEAQRESVLAAYDEKNAIIDLIKDGYDKASDALSKLIDKRKEALEADKDLHDYQKSIQEKSDKVTELEKQKKAYDNDASEEAKKQVQQIEINLKDAQEDLAETEYDKYISDQEKLLDDLQTEYEDFINDRIDNIDKELNNVADAVNSNKDTIRNTLEELSRDTELPLTKAMLDVWNSATPVVDLNTTTQGIGNAVSGVTSAIDGIISRLNDLIAIMRGNMESEINKYDDGSYNPDNSNSTPTTSNESNPTPEPESIPDDSESDDNSDSDDGNYDDLFVYKYYYPQPLNTETSVVDRLKSNDIDASWDRRADYYAGIFGDEEYTGADYQNIRMLDWLKEHGYAKGKKRGEYSTGYHLVGEEGNEFMITNGALREVGTEDTIFTADMAKNIADFSVDPTQYLSSHMPLPNVKPMSTPNNVTSNVDTIEISLPNVTNYTEFKTQLMNDRGFKNYMSEATLGVALGHNELTAYKYK